MSANPLDVLARYEAERKADLDRLRGEIAEGNVSNYGKELHDLVEQHCAAVEARDAVVALTIDRDRLQAKLDTKLCGNGHDNVLPLELWDCPACHEETKRKLTRLIEAAEAALAAGVIDINDEPDRLREALADAKGVNHKGESNAKPHR